MALILVTADTRQVTALAGRLRAAGRLSRADAMNLARAAIRIIRRRTASGLDERGKEFEWYSDQYARRRRAWGLQVEHVDLYRTGGMMNSMRPTAFTGPYGYVGRVYFANARARGLADIHQNGLRGHDWKRTDRPFLGIHSRTAAHRELTTIARSMVEANLRRAVSGGR